MLVSLYNFVNNHFSIHATESRIFYCLSYC